MAGYREFIKTTKEEKTPAVLDERGQTYKHPIVKSIETDLSSVISHISGSTFIVDYYSQMLYRENQPNAYDENQTYNNQQYHVIYNMELKLQSQSVDTEQTSNVVNLTGSAVMFTTVIPNEGDVIISDIGDGIAGRMSVKNVQKKTYLSQTVYEFDYELLEMLNQEKMDKLNSFVIKESVFDRSLIANGTNPVILKSDYAKRIDAEDVYSELIDDFMKEFFSNELGSFVVPGYATKPTYDPYAVRAFIAVAGDAHHPLIRKLRELNVNEIKEAYTFSIWPVLIDPTVNKISNIWKEAGPVPATRFNVNPYMGSFRYSRYYQCISPVEDLANVDYYAGWAQQNKSGSILTASSRFVSPRYSSGVAIGSQLKKLTDGETTLCCHHLAFYYDASPVVFANSSRTWMQTIHKWITANHMEHCDTCGGCNECCCCNPTKPTIEKVDYSYVLNSNFWSKDAIDDKFNSIVRKRINGKTIEITDIVELINKRLSLPPKERFYQMLTLLVILKATLRYADGY